MRMRPITSGSVDFSFFIFFYDESGREVLPMAPIRTTNKLVGVLALLSGKVTCIQLLISSAEYVQVFLFRKYRK